MRRHREQRPLPGDAEAGAFSERYVFPDAAPLHLSRITLALERAGFEPVHSEGFRLDYAATLRHWAQNIDDNGTSCTWPLLRNFRSLVIHWRPVSTAEFDAQVRKLATRYPDSKTAILPALRLAQEQNDGWLDTEWGDARIPFIVAPGQRGHGVGAFILEHLEDVRQNAPETRNVRLAAIKSFFHFLEYQHPTSLEQIRRVLAIPYKRTNTRLVPYLAREEDILREAAAAYAAKHARKDEASA